MQPFAESSGIELLESLQTIACGTKQIYDRYVAECSEEHYMQTMGWAKEQAATFSVQLGDILEADWGDCDLIFIASLLFN